MKKISILCLIFIILLVVALSGCGDNNTNLTTTETQSTETTTSVTEPVEIEAEYELLDNETKSLVAVFELEVITKAKEVTVRAVLASVKIAVPHITVVGEFYDASGSMVYTNYADYKLDASQTHRSMDIAIPYYTDNPSVVTKCKLIISAHE
ncbi:MAG: hypothetical protein PHF74_05200 [Dehalococcoidales bacterium]|nr:hypothetical protein [Dehalococcoidales bacterium]